MGQEVARQRHRIGKAGALQGDASGKAPARREGRRAVQQHEDAAVVGPADQPPEGLLQAQPRQPSS